MYSYTTPEKLSKHKISVFAQEYFAFTSKNLKKHKK